MQDQGWHRARKGLLVRASDHTAVVPKSDPSHETQLLWYVKRLQDRRQRYFGLAPYDAIDKRECLKRFNIQSSCLWATENHKSLRMDPFSFLGQSNRQWKTAGDGPETKDVRIAEFQRVCRVEKELFVLLYSVEVDDRLIDSAVFQAPRRESESPRGDAQRQRGTNSVA